MVFIARKEVSKPREAEHQEPNVKSLLEDPLINGSPDM